MKVSTFINKSVNHIKLSKKTYFHNRKYFGKKLANEALKADIVILLPISNKSKCKYCETLDRQIYDCLIKKYQYLIDKYNNEEETLVPLSKKYIWVFWYQGLDNAPSIVKKCIQSIKENSFDYEVMILDKDNISKYIDIPQIVLEKVKNKIVTLTHFSDILRMGLLSKYGGIWVDATCYITSDVFKKFDNKKFNSCHGDKTLWTSFLIGGRPNKIFQFTYDLLIDYSTEYNAFINYFLIDRAMKLAYNNIQGCQKIINEANIDCKNIYNLGNHFNDKYDEREYDKLIKSAPFFKLTYKVEYKEKDTNYQYFISAKKEVK